MAGPEGKVENYLKTELERFGFKVVKFEPVGFAGAPDRWIFRPKWSPGPAMCVELKAEGKTLRSLQTEVGKDLQARGVTVLPFIDSKNKVDVLVAKLLRICIKEADLVERAKLPEHILKKANRHE